MGDSLRPKVKVAAAGRLPCGCSTLIPSIGPASGRWAWVAWGASLMGAILWWGLPSKVFWVTPCSSLTSFQEHSSLCLTLMRTRQLLQFPSAGAGKPTVAEVCVWWLISSGSGFTTTPRCPRNRSCGAISRGRWWGGGVPRAFKTGLKMGAKDSQYLMDQLVSKYTGQEREKGR